MRKNWRLYKKYQDDPWQLFDLVADPEEKKDVAAQHPEVIAQMAARHAEWSKTLAPLGKVPKNTGEREVIPGGHGWATSERSATPGEEK